MEIFINNKQFCGNRCGWNEIFAGTGGDRMGVLWGWKRNWMGMGREGKLNLQGQLRTGVIFVSMHVSDNYRHTSHDGEPGFVFSSIMCVCVCVHLFA